MGKNVHVVPKGGKWAVKKEGNPTPTSTHNTQRVAIKAGRDEAIKQRSELVIHNPKGQIRDKDSFGNDPVPPKDTKH